MSALPGTRDERALAQLIRRGDRRAREELIAMHVPLARALALRYRRPAEPTEDLVQVAIVGLVKAVDRWDPERGVDLRSYATPTMLGELRHYFRDCTWGVRPPRRLQNLSIAIERARDELRSQLGRSPTVADLARRVGCDQETVIEGLQAGHCRSLESLDGPPAHADEDSARVGELIPVVDQELERVEMRATNERLITVLDAEAREIMRLRFEENMLQSEIASRIGRSQMHVSRVIAASLEKLHVYATARNAPARAAGGGRCFSSVSCARQVPEP
jgi:RNA polymerase sigma-B factor